MDEAASRAAEYKLHNLYKERKLLLVDAETPHMMSLNSRGSQTLKRANLRAPFSFFFSPPFSPPFSISTLYKTTHTPSSAALFSRRLILRQRSNLCNRSKFIFTSNLMRSNTTFLRTTCETRHGVGIGDGGGAGENINSITTEILKSFFTI